MFLYMGLSERIKMEEEEWLLYKISWGHTMVAKVFVNLQHLHINFTIKITASK